MKATCTAGRPFGSSEGQPHANLSGFVLSSSHPHVNPDHYNPLLTHSFQLHRPTSDACGLPQRAVPACLDLLHSSRCCSSVPLYPIPVHECFVLALQNHTEHGQSWSCPWLWGYLYFPLAPPSDNLLSETCEPEGHFQDACITGEAKQTTKKRERERKKGKSIQLISHIL